MDGVRVPELRSVYQIGHYAAGAGRILALCTSVFRTDTVAVSLRDAGPREVRAGGADVISAGALAAACAALEPPSSGISVVADPAADARWGGVPALPRRVFWGCEEDVDCTSVVQDPAAGAWRGHAPCNGCMDLGRTTCCAKPCFWVCRVLLLCGKQASCAHDSTHQDRKWELGFLQA